MFRAQYHERKGCWRIVGDYTAVGGEVIDICGAVNEHVARETAAMMNAGIGGRRAA